MSVRAVTTSTLWQIASQFTMAVLSIVTVKFIAIGLSKELVGNYNSSYAYLQLFGILADFGLYAVAVRELSVARNKEKILGVLIVIRSAILTFSLSIALCIAFVIPKWQGTPLPLGIVLASFVPFFTLLAGILRSIFQIHFRMQYVFVAEVFQRVLTVSLIGIVIAYGVRNSTDIRVYEYFIGVGGIGAMLLFLLSLVFGSRFMRIRPQWDSRLIKAIFLRAAPFGIAFLCISIYRQLDVTLIALLRPDYEIQNAYYGFVLRMTEVGYIIPTFVLNSVLPIIVDRDSANIDSSLLLAKTLFIILMFGSASSLYTLLWARPLVSLLTTEAYLSSGAVLGSDAGLMLLSFPLFLNGLILMSFYTLLARNKWKALVMRMLLAAGISIGLNLVLIPMYGFIGAAMTTIFVHIILVGLLWPVSQKAMSFHFPKRFLVRWVLFTTGLAATLALLRPLAITPNTTILWGIVSFIIILGLLKTLKIPKELGLRFL